MIDYSNWKESQLAVTSLLLDPNNPRIPDSSENLSQRDIIAVLVAKDKIYELAENIVKNGYYPVESLIFVEEKKKKYVVEGNRRLAALKLLVSPDMAPDSILQRRFRALSNRINLTSVRKVKVIKAPTREAAAPVIMSKHTQKQVESWCPLMQDKFYRNLINQGMTVNDIAEEYKHSSAEITNALQRYMMYSIACTMNFPEDVAKKIQNPREFPVTNLERLYKNPKVTQFLGISFDENKRLLGDVDEDEFKKGYTKIITDIATKAVHSRILNTTASMDEYLSSFGELKPNLQKRGSFTDETFLDVDSNLERKKLAEPIIIRKKNKQKPIRRSIIPEKFSCDVTNQRVNDVFNELKNLPVAQYPNAVALMFRSLLEMSLSHFLDRTGNLIKLTGKLQEGLKNRGDNRSHARHPTLKEMLQYVANEDNKIISNGNLLKSLNKLISQKDDLLSIDTLNLCVHNQHYYPNEDNLRQFWAQLQGLFEIILVDPNGDEEPQ